MSPNSRAEARWLALGLMALAGNALGDEEAAAAATAVDAALDMEFLEYLGSWDTSDEEWMLFAGEEESPAARTDPAPEREESVESNDEG